MNKIYLSHNNIISSLGFDSPTVIRNIHDGQSGIRQINNEDLLPTPFYASLIDTDILDKAFETMGAKEDYTRLERMFLVSLSRTINASNIKLTNRVGLIISTTKGNIDTLDPSHPLSPQRAYLGVLGQIVKNYFGFKTEPIILSNACVSGILAISVAKRFIARGTFDQVFIVGGDVVTPFILSGFQSFQALSDRPCKPYDKQRSGINIGEVAASILVT